MTWSTESTTARHPPMSCICESFIRGNRRSFSTVDGMRFNRCDTSGSPHTFRAVVRRYT